MDYYYKSQKYINKIILYAGSNKNLPNQGIDMEIYFILNGGKPLEILTLINNEFSKIKDDKYILGLRSINQLLKINYRIIKNNYASNSIKYTPALTAGGYSAIYELNNETNKGDHTKYLLRLFNRKSTYNTNSNIYHMCDKKKVKEEYVMYNKYMIDIYHYGMLKVHETGKARPTTVDYIITKMYKTSETDKINNFTYENKLTFLKNNILMLLEIRKNNHFLGDYKLSNIGWDDNLNIILIDYDSDAIIKVEDKVFIYRSGVKRLTFNNTYIPKYLTVNRKYRSSDVNDLDITKYDKYSTGGLTKIIEVLELDINLIEEFKLNDSNYDNIMTYEDMLTKINLLNK